MCSTVKGNSRLCFIHLIQLHLMCKYTFACHIFFLELPCPPEKEIMSSVYPQYTVLTVRDTMKTHFKVLLSIPRIFLNFVSFPK